ncbi:MAG TPA: MFS transporter [Rhizomicrobium sp.]|nr:MFS transporter [Rhizomicrobium sp.]
MTLARHRLVGITFTLTMLLYVDRIAISAGKSAVAQQFALSDTQFGWVLSAFALGYALFQVPAGLFVDRFGARVALTLVVGAWSLFTGLTGLAWSLGSLLLFRLLFGFAEAGAFPTCARAFYAWLPVSERGLAQGINLSGSRLGAAFALPLVAWLLLIIGWRTAFLALAAAGILWAAGWYLWFRNTPEEHSGISDAERTYIAANRGAIHTTSGLLPLRELLALPNIWLLMGQYFASNFTFFFCLTWLFPYLQRTYHLNPLTTGFYSALPLVCGALGNWCGGALVDGLYRRGLGLRSRQLPAMAGFSLAAVGIIASLVCNAPLPAVLCLSVAMFGSDMTVSCSWAFAIDIGGGHSGAVSGVMNMAGNLGSFVTSLAFPYLALITGSSAPFFVAGAAFNAMAVFLWSRARTETPASPGTPALA